MTVVRRHGPAVLIALAAVLLGPAADARAALTLTGSEPLGPRLSQLTFTSDAVRGPVRARLLMPAGAATEPARRYPVLYLLHGSSQGAADWTRDGEAAALTAGLDLIVVMPDGGDNGWYTNGLGSGAPRWEDFHMNELLPWVDAHLPTIASRAGRAIAGLSMGGFGALSYAARHPDRFAAAASFSGPLALGRAIDDPARRDAVLGGAPWGPWDAPGTEERWRAHDPYTLAENLRGLSLHLACGSGAASGDIESLLHDQTAALAARLAALGIPRTWDDYGPGGHAWPFWTRDLRAWLPQLMAAFARSPRLPARVTHRSGEARFAIRGWTVAASGERLRRLVHAGPRGFVLHSPTRAVVTTPRRYRTGRWYRVGVRSAGARPTRHRRLRAAGGRLRISVPGSARVTVAPARSPSS